MTLNYTSGVGTTSTYNFPTIGMGQANSELEELEAKRLDEEKKKTEEDSKVEQIKGNGENYYNNIEEIESALSELSSLENSDKVEKSKIYELKSDLKNKQTEKLIQKTVTSKNLEDESLLTKIADEVKNKLNGANQSDQIAINGVVSEIVKNYEKTDSENIAGIEQGAHETEDEDSARKASKPNSIAATYSKFAQSFVSTLNQFNELKNLIGKDESEVDISA